MSRVDAFGNEALGFEGRSIAFSTGGHRSLATALSPEFSDPRREPDPVRVGLSLLTPIMAKNSCPIEITIACGRVANAPQQLLPRYVASTSRLARDTMLLTREVSLGRHLEMVRQTPHASFPTSSCTDVRARAAQNVRDVASMSRDRQTVHVHSSDQLDPFFRAFASNLRTKILSVLGQSFFGTWTVTLLRR